MELSKDSNNSKGKEGDFWESAVDMESYNPMAKGAGADFAKLVEQCPSMLNDYTCSVQTYRNTRCRRKFSCSVHREKDKKLVQRSRPLSVLRREEQCNPVVFTDQKRVVKKMLLDLDELLETRRCSASLRDHAVFRVPQNTTQPQTVATCDIFSHLLLTPPRRSVLPASGRGISKRQIYMNLLSRSCSHRLDDVVTYLHFRLNPILSMSESERVESIYMRLSLEE